MGRRCPTPPRTRVPSGMEESTFPGGTRLASASGMLTLLLACSDYDYANLGADKDGADADTGFRPRDGRDDEQDGDDSASVTQAEDEGDCTGTHTLRIGLAADDWFELWIDEEPLAEAEHWWETTWVETEVEGCRHVIAVHGKDLHQAISGFIAQTWVDDVEVSRTGDGTWVTWDGLATGSWKSVPYDDSAWALATPCDRSSAEGWWGSQPPDLRASGAWWIWPHECLGLGEASFRLDIDLR